ncbi:MAG TPA: CaiB/BaiF CoA-transferase family protein [Verrucomicrobiae bacterium]|nr:CaiB/BaiF CoA-transferase family protein [Verrucomicrobiae bacterium]
MYKLLSGVKILDLTRLLPGGYATQLLGDLGAEVVKVEDPWQGDYMRWMEPHFPGTGESALYWGLNRNKKSVALNLKSEKGRQVFLKLVQKYDVVLEGFRPGVMDKLGLGYEELKAVNPGVIMCSISGYGQDGPYKFRSGHDINYTATAGSLGLTGLAGETPIVPALQIADLGGGGLMAAVGILSAYIARQNTGEGQYIDVSMMDGVVSWMAMLFMQQAVGDTSLARGCTWLNGGIICYGVYPTKDDKYMALGALEPKFWTEFCQAVEREDLISRQFSGTAGDRAEVEGIFRSRTRQEWSEFFADKDVCCEPVLEMGEVKQHPQVAARNLFTTLNHPTAGPVQAVANPLKFGNAGEQTDRVPPGLGEHTREILLDLGLTERELEEIKG